eukprot:2816760-Rhodomonas_salina.1
MRAKAQSLRLQRGGRARRTEERKGSLCVADTGDPTTHLSNWIRAMQYCNFKRCTDKAVVP